MKRILSTFSIVLLLAISGNSAIADEVIYRWMDERGAPVNSDRPPPKGVDYEVVSTSTSMVRSVDSDEGVVPLEVEPSPSNDFEPVDSRKPEIEKNPEFCQRAQDNLTQLDTHARIRLRNEEGEIRYLDEEEKAAERQKANDAIDAFCE